MTSATKTRLYGGRDPIEIPLYSVPRVSHHVGVSQSTLWTWCRGTEPLIKVADSERRLLSFVNLIEAYTLRALRVDHGVSMHGVREVLLEYPRHHKGAKDPRAERHPLAFEDFLAGFGEVFIERLGTIINLSRDGQVELREIVSAYLERVKRGKGLEPVQLLPPVFFDNPRPDHAPILIDPRMVFGRPVIAGTRIPTEEIRSRMKAGDTLAEIAEDFDQPEEKVKDALAFEKDRARFLKARAA